MEGWESVEAAMEFMRSYATGGVEPTGRRWRGDTLDKEQWIADHERGRREMEAHMNLASVSTRLMKISVVEHSSTASVPLSGLKAITFPDLVLGERHYGRVLYGRLCVEPFKVNSVNSVLEDSSGRGLRLLVYNVVLSSASPREVKARFPSGARVAVKEPYYKMCSDGKVALRVDNPGDICYLDVVTQVTTPGLSDSSTLLERFVAFRSHGNRLFAEQNWAEAASKYSQCIDEYVSSVDDARKENISDFNRLDGVVKSNDPQLNGVISDDSKLDRGVISDDSEFNKVISADSKLSGGVMSDDSKVVSGGISDDSKVVRGGISDDPRLVEEVMLAYSNRAEAWLRLKSYEATLSDADKALETHPNHLKSLIRKGKALHGLARYERACDTFKAALEESPKEQSIVDLLRASAISQRQSKHGIFELSDYLSKGGKGQAPPCADFLGPVEIRRVQYGIGRRGLFATRNVQAGELLLVSNPFAIARRKSQILQVSMQLGKNPTTTEKGRIDSGSQDDLVVELANGVLTSKLRLAQLYSLVSDGQDEMAIPSMELFRPGSEWIPPEADKLLLDIGLIRRIATLNAFGNGADHLLPMLVKKNDVHPQSATSGIWLLPSFANHSCIPNCVSIFIGDALFLRCARDVLEGEELTITYSNATLHECLEARQAKGENWHFTCECERCLLEGTLKPKLANISKVICDEVAAHQEVNTSQGIPKPLARAFDKVERVLEGIYDPRQQVWIRAGLFEGYIWKHRLSGSGSAVLEFVFDVVKCVCPSMHTIQLASELLSDIGRKCSKNSELYKKAESRVFRMYKIVFGEQSDKVLRNLLKFHEGKFFDPYKFWSP